MNLHLRNFRKADALALKNMAERMSRSRSTLSKWFAELKLAIADTTVFTNALYAALDDYEQRIGTANAKVHHEVAALQQQSHASALVQLKGSLIRFKAKPPPLRRASRPCKPNLKVMLTLAQQAQADIQVKADALVGELRQLQAWSAKMNQGGFWARLLWLLRGIATKT
jgi:septal ring factor EnvC (AmiA/AmiB activator)